MDLQTQVIEARHSRYLPRVKLDKEDWIKSCTPGPILAVPESVFHLELTPRSPENGNSNAIVFAENARHLMQALSHCKPRVVVSPQSLKSDPALSQFDSKSTDFVFVEKFPMARVSLLQAILKQNNELLKKTQTQIASSAEIHPTALIGDGVVIGERVQIGPFVVVENGARIGDETKIAAGCFIGERCHIGKRVTLQPGVKLGPDGFGFTHIQNEQGERVPLRIPHTGVVYLDDDVEVGANSLIARATLEVTFIGKRTKIDNLVHIAHNCIFGSDNMITAGFMTGGSSRFGNRFQAGGHCTLRDHIEIGDDIQLGGFSCVTESLKEPGSYNGYPARPLKESLRILASLKKLPDLIRKSRGSV